MLGPNAAAQSTLKGQSIEKINSLIYCQ
ncbi:hypothetical protein EMIT093MI4_70256 [Pseudomonas sp. IT-93MI4]